MTASQNNSACPVQTPGVVFAGAGSDSDAGSSSRASGGQSSAPARAVMSGDFALDVLVALVPVLSVAVYLFGAPVLLQVLLGIVTCVVADRLLALFAGIGGTLRWHWRLLHRWDWSAVVTGAILAMSLPEGSEWYLLVVGASAATVLCKVLTMPSSRTSHQRDELVAGVPVFNPAMVGRLAVAVIFGLGVLANHPVVAAASSEATALARARETYQAPAYLWMLLWGTKHGALADVSVLACFVGGLYLCIRRRVPWTIPMAVVAGVWFPAALGNLINPLLPNAEAMVGSGMLVFGACFIVADPAGRPAGFKGQMAYGLAIGAGTWLLRTVAVGDEGIMFAILLVNGAVAGVRWMGQRPAKSSVVLQR